MDKFLSIENVGQVFKTRKGDFIALRDINLTVAKGEFISLIGHSGCGKSTLLNLVAGLTRPTSGALICAGREIDGPGPERAVVFQNHSLLPWFSCYKNIHLGVERVFGATESKARLRERTLAALQLVGLAHAEHKLPHEISGGMKQRVGIARALANRPRLLLCDEATSALDPETTQSILRLLGDINRRLGLTIVLITHSMDVIRAVCDRVAVIEAGRIVESGEVLEVFLHPRHDATQSLLSESGMDAEGWRAMADGLTGRLLRLSFRGDATVQPLLSRISRELSLDLSILQGSVGRIKDTPFGQLVVCVQGPDESLARLDAMLSDAGVDHELLRP